jgi:chaperonin GroES
MLKPINNRILVRPDEKETETPSGIIIPDNSVEKPLSGVVISVSTYGDLAPVKVGDRVLFSRYGYDETKASGETLYIVSESSILAIYE